MSGPRSAWRARGLYFPLALATIALGLLVHLRGSALAPDTRDVLGDALWAAMVVWWLGVLAPRVTVVARGATAYVLCVLVEATQLLHLPALDAARATLVGHLILGSGFDYRDLVAYAVGVAAAALLDAALVARRRGEP